MAGWAALAAALLLAAALPAAGEEKGMGRTPGDEGTTEPAELAPIATSLLPSPASPLITFRIQFGVGSVDDPKGKEGLNAVTAMTIGEGGTKELTYRELVDRLYPMAASITAQPDREVTTFIGDVHRDHLKAFYPLVADRLLEPRFDPADFTRVRDLLLAALQTNLRGNDDETLGKEALNGMMYEGQPYGHPDIGTVQGLKAITLDDVKAFYRARYTRGTVRVGLTGGYPAALLDSVQRDFKELPGTTPPRLALSEPRPIEGMEVLIVEKPAPAAAISLGYPIKVTRADKDFYALMVANSYFGEHRTFNGRLMNKMRGERGLNYGDYSYVESFTQDGGSHLALPNVPRRRQDFTIWIRPVAPANAIFALRQATRELERFVSKGLAREDFEATRAYLLNYSRLWTQSLSRRLGYQLDSEFYGTAFFIDRVQEELPKLTLETVNAAVKRHLNARNIKVAIVTDGAGEIRAALLSGRPTPITYQTPTTDEDLLKEDKEIESYPLPINKERVRIVQAQDLFER